MDITVFLFLLFIIIVGISIAKIFAVIVYEIISYIRFEKKIREIDKWFELNKKEKEEIKFHF